MEDEDTCRICRSGPEPGAPLYHPCKCTGSIRYCHQDCLVEWLQHSRKKYCELCNHPFIFHKKYRKDMPSDGNLPRYLYFRRLVIRAIQLSQLGARGLLVGFTWLALLPYININVWRFLFWSIDVATWMGIPGAVPPFDIGAPPASNLTTASNSTNSSAEPLGRFSSRNTSSFRTGTLGHIPISMDAVKAALRTFTSKLAHDIFEGQILSCVIVVFFVGVFLLREWILQNVQQHFDVQPNLDGLPPVQQLAADAAQLEARLAAQADQLPPAQMQQRRELLEQAFAVLREHEAEHPVAAAELAGEREQQHELDLDPEAQREQARQARIRRLEQALVRSDGQPKDHAEEGSHEEMAGPSTAGDTQTEQEGGSHLATGSSSSLNLQDSHDASEVQRQLADQAVAADLEPEQQRHHEDATQSNQDGAAQASDSRNSDASRASDEEDNHEDADEQHSNGVGDSAYRDAVRAYAEGDDNDERQGNENEAYAPEVIPVDAAILDAALAAPDQPPTPTDEDDAWEDESSDDRAPAADAALEPDEAALRAAAAAAFPPPIVHPAADDEIPINAAAAAAAGDADDPDAEIGIVEEMDGILEAVGMRGPVFGIVQNLFLMIFLCGFVMLVLVMAPYVVGRVLGSGPGLVRVLGLPVRLLRYVTDPVFDVIIKLGARGWLKIVEAAGMAGGDVQASKVVSEATTASAGWMKKYLPTMLSMKNGTKAAEPVVADRTSATAAMLVRLLPTSVTSSTQWKAVSDSFDIALSTGLRGTLHRIADFIISIFTRLDAHRIGTSSVDRAFCIAFGHSYWLLILFIHQHFSTPDLSKPDASAMKMFMDQHILILKSLIFIFIELAIFPLGCGLLFDICAMPLFPHASIWDWPGKVRAAPLTFAFVRWMAGTIYMFVFAQYVSVTRKVLRPGVLCWIRDPNDPNFHPIREILDKKATTQLRKIGASAMMYAATLVVSVGVNTYGLRYVGGWSGVLPLRWKPYEAVTEVPVDLLAVHFVLPWATQKLDPEKVAEKVLKMWWMGAARVFRLSTYFVGGEFKEERRMRREGNAWGGLFGRSEGGEEWVEDGQQCRVPADDKAITSGPLIIPLNPDGTPTTERYAEAVTNQEIDAEKHTPKPTYTNIWLPSNFRRRITAVLVLLWLSHSMLFILGLSVPLLLGRTTASLLLGKKGEVHDFYSFSLGLTLIGVGFRLKKSMQKMWSRRIRRAKLLGRRPKAYVVVHLLLRVERMFKAFALLVGVAGLVPLTVGLLIDQYVLVPLRYRSTEIPTINLGQVWAQGIIQTRLLLFVARLLGVPTEGAFARFMSNVDHVVRGGIYPRPQVVIAWKRIVLPITFAGAVLLITPVVIANGIAKAGWVEAATKEQEQVLVRKVFGLIQSAGLVAGVRAVVKKRMESWTDVLKDEVFLESTELKNYTEPAEEGGEGKGEVRRGEQEVAEGTLPDVLFR